jgi:uncharacterized protein
VKSALITGLALVAGLKVLVWWLEPRMAFFPYAGIQQTPAAARVQYADVTIPTADGKTLHGWWLEDPSARAQVIYWHGNGGNLSVWLPVITDLRARGFSILVVDYRGYGASSGTPSERGIYKDADAVTQYFDRHLRKTGVPTVYWGRSLGCAAGSYGATVKAPDGLVLESPFPDVASLFAGNPLMRVLSVFSSYSFATSQHLVKYSGPLLVVHGDADSIVPFAAGKQVFERAPSAAKTFAVLPGADHNDPHSSHAAYWSAVDAFVQSLTPRER